MTTNTENKWFYANGELKGELPTECVDECSASGSVDGVVTEWIEKLEFKVPREQGIKYLDEYGMDTDFNEESDHTIAMYVLWLACGDISEGQDFYGVIH